MADVLKGLEIKNMTDISADLYFYGDIVSDWWGAWQNEDQYPDAIKNFLSQAEGKDLNVYVNSGGGSVFAGMAIYNMIKRHGEKNKVESIRGRLGRFDCICNRICRNRAAGNSVECILDDSQAMGRNFRERGRNAKKWRTIWIKYRPES